MIHFIENKEKLTHHLRSNRTPDQKCIFIKTKTKFKVRNIRFSVEGRNVPLTNAIIRKRCLKTHESMKLANGHRYNLIYMYIHSTFLSEYTLFFPCESNFIYIFITSIYLYCFYIVLFHRRPSSILEEYIVCQSCVHYVLNCHLLIHTEQTEL